MNPNYDDVAAITQHVVQTMARLESEPAAEVSWKDADLLLGKIQIQGAWAGEIQIRTTEALAKQLAEQMLQVPSDDLQDEDIKDVLAEVTNMIGGNIKSQLDSPSTLTLPCVATELGGSTSESNDTLLCNLHILCRDNPLSIQILSQK
ncbi:chemotaxis protein CheX [Pirellulaceae bacterium SH501]